MLHFERIFPEHHDAMKAVLEIIGVKSAAKAVEAYTPFTPGNISTTAAGGATSTPKNKLARRNASFFDDGSDDDDEEISVTRKDLKMIFGKMATADRIDRYIWISVLGFSDFRSFGFSSH